MLLSEFIGYDTNMSRTVWHRVFDIIQLSNRKILPFF